MMQQSNPEFLGRGMQELHSLAHRAMIMGNDDGESATIHLLAQRVQRGELSLDEAVTRARAIVEGKDEI